MSRWKQETLEERFKAKVIITDNCWLWDGGKVPDGYGSFRVSSSKVEAAHRVAYVLAYGDIPDGLFVLHSCDNPPCVRPSHLWLGTGGDNARDMIAKGRANRKGDNANHRKLTSTQVVAIRSKWAAGGTTQRALAKEYGVHYSTIHLIVRNLVWT